MTIPNVTFESNCLIALEKNEDTAPYLRELIQLFEEGAICLQVVAISASEKQVDKSYAHFYGQFEHRLQCLGLTKARQLFPLAYTDITYLDRSVWGGTATQLLEREIHQILWPELPFRFTDYKHIADQSKDKSKRKRKKDWRNAKCDTLAFWSHVFHGGGLFVSNDKVFHQKTKKPLLLTLSGGDIVRPADAKVRLNSGHSLTPVPENIVSFLRINDSEFKADDVPKNCTKLWGNRTRYEQSLNKNKEEK